MLGPDQRSTLLELLEPPTGFALDAAVGLTYTLSLDALLTLPSAFALGGGVSSDERDDGGLTPLEVLSALRSYAGQMTVCCDAAGIALPPGPRWGVFAFLENTVVPMRAPRGGVFHPKVWAVRFADPSGAVVHRLLVSSRNLTFDRSWDTVVRLDEDGEGIRLPGVGQLLADCADGSMSPRAVPVGHRERLTSMAESIRRARFSPPPGFTSLGFHSMGSTSAVASPRIFPAEARRTLIVSPFLTRPALERLPGAWDRTVVVSRPEEIDRIAADLQDPAARTAAGDVASGFFVISPSVVDDASDGALSGLHAKLFVLDLPGGRSRVFTGSANATSAAFGSNVEVLVEMEGSTRHVGVQAFLAKGALQDLIIEHQWGGAVEPTDEAGATLDALRKALALLPLTARVTQLAGNLYEVRYVLDGPLVLDGVQVEVRPLTLANWTALPDGQPLDIAYELDELGISAFLAVRLSKDSRETTFLLKAELVGAPESRDARIIAALLANPARFIRYLMMLLLDPSSDRFDGAVQEMVEHARRGQGASLQTVPLLEVMARALLGPRGKLVEVDRLIIDLEEASTLVDTDLHDLWQAMRAAAKLGAS